MTAKEALLERVLQLSEAEAAMWLLEMDTSGSDFDTLTADELAEVEAAEEDMRGGHWVDGDRLLAKLGLWSFDSGLPAATSSFALR